VRALIFYIYLHFEGETEDTTDTSWLGYGWIYFLKISERDSIIFWINWLTLSEHQCPLPVFSGIVLQELLTLPELLRSPPLSSAVRVARSLVFCVLLCILSLFVLLRLYRLSFELRLLDTPLVSSNFLIRMYKKSDYLVFSFCWIPTLKYQYPKVIPQRLQITKQIS